jgi:MoxR-like ATPase
MFKLKVHYPNLEEELQVVQRMARPQLSKSVSKVLNLEALEALRAQLGAIYIDEKIERYLLRIVRATREPEQYGLQIAPYIRYGASPRASIFLALAARGHALMEGADYVRPHDVKAVAHDVLRHRIALSYRAEAESIVSDTLIDQILNQIPIHIATKAV